MAIMSLDPTGKGQARWTMRWKTALNAFDITFEHHLRRLSSCRAGLCERVVSVMIPGC